MVNLDKIMLFSLSLIVTKIGKNKLPMSQETTTTLQQTPAGKNEKHMPGEEGVWILIFGDMMVFTLLFAVYLFYRAIDLDIFSIFDPVIASIFRY